MNVSRRSFVFGLMATAALATLKVRICKRPVFARFYNAGRGPAKISLPDIDCEFPRLKYGPPTWTVTEGALAIMMREYP